MIRKQSLQKIYLKTIQFSLYCFFALQSGLLFGQQEDGGGNGGGDNGDMDINVDIGAENGDAMWYESYWIWIIGIALFVIIIVAIISASRSGRND